MPQALILTAPQSLTAPLPDTPILRLAGDVVTLTSDTFTGGNVSTLLGRSTDAKLGGTPMRYECLDPASWAITDGQLTKGPSTRTNSSALVELPAGIKDLTVSVKVTSMPVQTLAGPAMYLQLRRDNMPQPRTQLRLGLYATGSYALSTQIASTSQVYVPGTTKPYALGDTIAVREYAGLVEIFRNGTKEISVQVDPVFTGNWAGLNTVDPSAFGFDNFKITETIH